MAASPSRPVVVVGGGMAGVTAAAALRRRGVPTRLYEAGPRLAGLAASFRDADGFTHDFGAHFITNRLAAAVGIAESCRDVRHYGEAVMLDGKAFGYPMGLLRRPAFTLGAMAARLERNGGPPESAAAWFRRKYGAALAREVAIPLVEAWSGACAEDLAASVAVEKLRHGPLYAAWLKLAALATRRAVASGYSHERPESPKVWHVYPEGGVGRLVERLAKDLDDTIRLESAVEAIIVDRGRVRAVRVAGREEEAAAVLSTAPCNVLPRLLRGTDALAYLSRFRYRAMTFLNLRLDGGGLLPDTVLWTPQADVPFFRLTETTRSMPWLAPRGKSMLTVDLGCEVGDRIWTMPDAELAELCLQHLAPIVSGIRQRLLGSSVLRTPIAYPLYLRAYEADRLRFRSSTGVAGLYSIGRNGEFAHILLEDIYWRTLNWVDRVVRDLEAAA